MSPRLLGLRSSKKRSAIYSWQERQRQREAPWSRKTATEWWLAEDNMRRANINRSSSTYGQTAKESMFLHCSSVSYHNSNVLIKLQHLHAARASQPAANGRMLRHQHWGSHPIHCKQQWQKNAFTAKPWSLNNGRRWLVCNGPKHLLVRLDRLWDFVTCNWIL